MSIIITPGGGSGGSAAWGDITGKPTIATTVDDPGSDSNLISEQAVREALDLLKVQGLAFTIEAGENKEYFISTDWPVDVACLITKITTDATSGTATANFKINSTSITNASAVAISSTEVATVPSGANTISQGDSLSVTLSSVSDPVDITVTIRYERAN